MGIDKQVSTWLEYERAQAEYKIADAEYKIAEAEHKRAEAAEDKTRQQSSNLMENLVFSGFCSLMFRFCYLILGFCSLTFEPRGILLTVGIYLRSCCSKTF